MLFDSSFQHRRKELRKRIEQYFFSIKTKFHEKKGNSLDSQDDALTIIDARTLNILIALYWDGFCKELSSTLQEKYKRVLNKSDDSLDIVKTAMHLLSHSFIKKVKNETKIFSKLDDRLWESLTKGLLSYNFTSNDFFFLDKDKKVISFENSFVKDILPLPLFNQLTETINIRSQTSDFFNTLISQLSSIYRTRNKFVHEFFSDTETFSLTENDFKTLESSYENINSFIDHILELEIEE
jgi:hypothetical protein